MTNLQVSMDKKFDGEHSPSENFECLMCGECCRAGYEVHICKEEVKKWKMLKKHELLENAMIKPECIEVKNEETPKNCEFTALKEELIDFILKNHLYYGKSSLRKHITTIIPNVDEDPIFAPKDFNTILKGLSSGLKYILRTDAYGTCPYLNLNLCSINTYKPIACKRFPYTQFNYLRNEKLFLNICEGIKRLKGYEFF